MHRDELLAILEGTLKSSGIALKVTIWICALVAFYGFLALVLDRIPFMDRNSQGPLGTILLILGIVMAAFTAFLRANHGDPGRNALYEAVRDRPESIVWAFVSRAKQDAVGFEVEVWAMVCVGLEDGTMGQLMLGKAEIERSMSLIAEIAPWATLGYSEETAALFRQSPKALLRFLPV